MATCSITDLTAASACFTQLMGAQATAVELSLLCKILQAANPMASCDVQSLLSDASCFMCLRPGQADAVRLQLLCDILQVGGTGSTCLLGIPGTGTPPATAPCPASLAYNEAGQFWFWDSFKSIWIAISV